MRAAIHSMTLPDPPLSLSIIAERHLARARATLEERGVDTADMPVAEIFDRMRGEREAEAEPAKPVAGGPDAHRPSRSWRTRAPARWDRAWRRGWRRRARSKNANHHPEQE
jgi:hypothetical protein